MCPTFKNSQAGVELVEVAQAMLVPCPGQRARHVVGGRTGPVHGRSAQFQAQIVVLKQRVDPGVGRR